MQVGASRIGLLLLLLPGLAQALPSSSTLDRVSPAVVKIRATQCATGDRSGTGFVWQSRDRIVTSLHVVADCKVVKAWYEKAGGERILTLSALALNSDLALMRVSDPVDVTPLQAATGSPQVNTSLLALGYPLDAQRMSDQRLRVQYGANRLRDLLSPANQQSLEATGTPSVNLEVLKVEGHLLPGMSGGPVLDDDGRVAGIADGGLERGAASISWAIPGSYLAALPGSNDQLPQNLRASVMQFATDIDSRVRDSVVCGQLELTKLRSRSLQELVVTTDDPTGLWQLSTALGFDQANFRYDVWVQLDSGATVVVPEGAKLENAGGLCGASDGSGVVALISADVVANVSDVIGTAARFEQNVLNRFAPFWQLDYQWSYAQPIQRFDGLLLNRKALVGTDGNQWNPTQIAYLFETIGTRGAAFVGIAAVDAVSTPYDRMLWGQCVQSLYRTPQCDALIPFRRAWAQYALGVALSTFPVG